MMMVFTDDPESLRRERENIAARVRVDPNYVPMVAVSSKNNRGRVDMVRLYHTLQEMDYLPVRQEIRERIGAMWGVTPAWQGAPEAFGGLSTQTTQLSVMSRVVESDQRMYHDKVFPQILDAFGITDWKLELQQPEEKAESTRLAFAQQKIASASMLLQMGFDIKIKSSEVGIMDVDFLVSGEPKKPEDMFGGGGMGGQQNMPPDQMGDSGYQNFGQPANSMPRDMGNQNMQMMLKQFGNNASPWIVELQKAGYPVLKVKGVSSDMTMLWFAPLNAKEDFVAKFNEGKLINVEKATFRGMHEHNGHPIHDEKMSHGAVVKEQQQKEIVDADDFNSPDGGG